MEIDPTAPLDPATNLNAPFSQNPFTDPRSRQGPLGDRPLPSGVFESTPMPEGQFYRAGNDLFYPGQDNLENQAQAQSNWGLLGKGLGQSVTSFVGMVGESIGGLYDLLEQGYYGITGQQDQTPWDNFISESSRAVSQWGQDAMPIDLTRQAMSSGAGRYMDPTFLASNLPSLVSTMAMFMPAWAAESMAVRGLGLAGRAAGLVEGAGTAARMARAFRAAAMTQTARQTVGLLAATAAGSHVENFMQAGQVMREEYEAALQRGVGEADARASAGRGAAHTYQMGWATAATNLLEYGIAMRGFKYANRAMNGRAADALSGAAEGTFARRLGDVARRNVENAAAPALAGRARFALDVGVQGLSEGLEEGYQEFLIGEGRRIAQGKENDGTSFRGRLLAAVQNPQVVDAMILGAVGGGLFGPVKERLMHRQSNSDRIADLERIVERAESVRRIMDPMSRLATETGLAASGLTQSEAGKLYGQAQDQIITGLGVNAAMDGRIDIEKEMFQSVMGMSDEEIAGEFLKSAPPDKKVEMVQEVRDRARRSLEVLDTVEKGFEKYGSYGFLTGTEKYDKYLPYLHGDLVRSEVEAKRLEGNRDELKSRLAEMESDTIGTFPESKVESVKAQLAATEKALNETVEERKALMNDPKARETFLKRLSDRHQKQADELQQTLREKKDATRRAKKATAAANKASDAKIESATDVPVDGTPGQEAESLTEAQRAARTAADEAKMDRDDALGEDTGDGESLASITDATPDSTTPDVPDNVPDFAPPDAEGGNPDSDPDATGTVTYVDQAAIDAAEKGETKQTGRRRTAPQPVTVPDTQSTQATQPSSPVPGLSGFEDTPAPAPDLSRVPGLPADAQLSDAQIARLQEAEKLEALLAQIENSPAKSDQRRAASLREQIPGIREGVVRQLKAEAAAPDVEADHAAATATDPETHQSEPSNAAPALPTQEETDDEMTWTNEPFLFKYFSFPEDRNEKGYQDVWFGDPSIDIPALIESGSLLVEARPFPEGEGGERHEDPKRHPVQMVLKKKDKNGVFRTVMYRGKAVTGYLPTTLSDARRVQIAEAIKAGKTVSFRPTQTTNGFIVTTHRDYKTPYGQGPRSNVPQLMKQTGQTPVYGVQLDTHLITQSDGKTPAYPRLQNEENDGVVYAVVQTPAGNPFPLPLHTRNVNEQEADLIFQAYRQVLEAGGARSEFSRPFQSQDGETQGLSVIDLLTLLVHQGRASLITYGDKIGPKTLHIDAGVLRVGDSMVFSTAEEMDMKYREIIEHIKANKLFNVRAKNFGEGGTLLGATRSAQAAGGFTLMGQKVTAKTSYLDFVFGGEDPRVASDVPLQRLDGAPLTQLFYRPALQLERVDVPVASAPLVETPAVAPAVVVQHSAPYLAWRNNPMREMSERVLVLEALAGKTEVSTAELFSRTLDVARGEQERRDMYSNQAGNRGLLDLLTRNGVLVFDRYAPNSVTEQIFRVTDPSKTAEDWFYSLPGAPVREAAETSAPAPAPVAVTAPEMSTMDRLRARAQAAIDEQNHRWATATGIPGVEEAFRQFITEAFTDFNNSDLEEFRRYIAARFPGATVSKGWTAENQEADSVEFKEDQKQVRADAVPYWIVEQNGQAVALPQTFRGAEGIVSVDAKGEWSRPKAGVQTVERTPLNTAVESPDIVATPVEETPEVDPVMAEFLAMRDAIKAMQQSRNEEGDPFGRDGRLTREATGPVQEPINAEVERNQVLPMLPAGITVELAEGLLPMMSGGVAWGDFRGNLVTLSRAGEAGTGFHEAFHAVFRTALTREEAMAHIQEARALWGADIPALEAEERMADAFMDYVRSGGRVKPYGDKGLLTRLFERLMSFVNAVAGRQGRRDLNKLFADIQSGAFGGTQMLEVSERYNGTPVAYQSAIPGLTQDQIRSLIDSVKYHAFEAAGLLKGDVTFESLGNLRLYRVEAYFQQQVLDLVTEAGTATPERQLQILPLAKQIAHVLQNWKAVEEATLNDLQRYGITGRDAENQQEIDEKDQSNDLSRMTRSSYEFSNKESATQMVRLLVSMQPVVQEVLPDGELVYDRSGFLGEPRMNRYGDLWGAVEDALVDIVPQYAAGKDGQSELLHGYQEMLKKLDVLGQRDANVAALRGRLLQLPVHVQTQFYQAFNLVDYDFATVEYVDERGSLQVRVGDAEVQSPYRDILHRWSTNWGQEMPEEVNARWSEVQKTGRTSDSETLLENVRTFLNSVGVEMSRDGMVAAVTSGEMGYDEGVQTLVGGLARVFGTKLIRSGLTTAEHMAQEKIFGRLAKAEAAASSSGGDNISLGPDGKPYWSRSRISTLFQTAIRLRNGDPELRRILMSDPLGKASDWLSAINADRLKTIRVRSILKLLKRDANSSSDLQQGAAYSDLKGPEKFALHLNMLMRGVTKPGQGVHPTMNMADKGDASGVQGMPVYSVIQDGTVVVVDGRASRLSSAMREKFARYAVAEWTRWAKAQKVIDQGNPSELVDNYHTGKQNALRVHLFPDLNPETLFETDPDLYVAIYDGSPDNARVLDIFDTDELSGTLIARVGKYIELSVLNAVNETIEEAERHGLVTQVGQGHKQGTEDSRGENPFIDAFLVQAYKDAIPIPPHVILALRKQYPDAPMDGIQGLAEIEVSNLAVTSILADFGLNQLMGDIEQMILFHGDWAYYKSHEDLTKRTPALVASGLSLRTDLVPEHYNVVVLKDVQRESPYAADLEDHFADFFERQGMSAEDARATAQARVKPFRKDENGRGGVNQTDAQGMITLSRARDILTGLGRWTPEMDEQVSGEVTNEDGIQKAWDDVFTSGELQSKKGVHFERTQDGSPVYLKYSQVILFPSLIKDSPGLQALAGWMEENDVQETVYESGVKVGARDARQIWTDDDQFVAPENATKIRLSNSHWRLQVDLPFHGMGATLLASQQQKNILSNIDPASTYLLDGKEVTGEEMVRTVHRLYASLSNIGTEGLLRELGATRKDLRVTEPGVLRDLLVAELRRKAAPDTLIDSLPFSPEGNLLSSLSGHPAASQLTSVLFSLLRSRAVRVKGPGGAMIQVSNQGFGTPQAYQGLTDEEKAGVHLFAGVSMRAPSMPVTNPETGERTMMPAGVLLPSWFKRQIPNADQMTGEEFRAFFAQHPDLLKVVGYRIPNQGKASIDVLEVVGFLPPSAGDAAVLYNEVTAKTGSDFDIDKMYFMVPAIRKTADGGLEVVPFLDDSNSTIEERYSAYLERAVGLERISRTVIGDERKKKTNRAWRAAEFARKDIRKKGFDAVQGAESAIFSATSQDGTVRTGIVDSWEQPDLYDSLKTLRTQMEGQPIQNRIMGYLQWTQELAQSLPDDHPLVNDVEDLFDFLREAALTFNESLDVAQVPIPAEVLEAAAAAKEVAIQEAVESGRALSLDAFSRRQLEGQNSATAVTNRLISVYHQMYADERVYLESMTPLDATTLQPQARYFKAVSVAGYKGSATNSAAIEKALLPYEDRSLLSKMTGTSQRRYNSVYGGGKRGVGGAANNLSDHSISGLARLGIFVDIGVGNRATVEIDGKPVVRTSLSEWLDEDGERISDTLSAVLNAFVDIAKDPYVFDLNLNLVTMNVGMLLLRGGASTASTFGYLKQPVLERLVEVTNSYESDLVQKQFEGGRVRASTEIVRLEMQKGLNDAMAAWDQENPASDDPFEQSEIAGRLNKILKTQKPTNALYTRGIRVGGQIARGETVPAQDLIKHYTFQLAALERYEMLEDASREVVNQMLASKSDSDAVGQDWATALVLRSRKHRAQASQLIDGFDRKMSLSTMTGIYDANTAGLVFPGNGGEGLFDRMMVELQPGFIAGVENLLTMIGKQATNVEWVRTAGRELRSLLYSDSPVHPTAQEAEAMLYGDDNMVARMLALKADDSPVKGNLMLQHLRYTPAAKGQPARIYSSYTLQDPDDIDGVSRAWGELLENPETQAFAEDLVKLSVLQSGMQKSIYTFHTLIPPGYLQSVGYYDHVKSREAWLADGGEFGQKAIYSVLLHLTEDPRFVPLIPKKVSVGDGDRFTVTEKQGESLISGRGLDDTPQFYPLVRKGSKVYQLLGYSMPGRVMYQIVEPLGSNYKGHKTVDYTLTRTRNAPVEGIIREPKFGLQQTAEITHQEAVNVSLQEMPAPPAANPVETPVDTSLSSPARDTPVTDPEALEVPSSGATYATQDQIRAAAPGTFATRLRRRPC